jgi:hypothetical protein
MSYTIKPGSHQIMLNGCTPAQSDEGTGWIVNPQDVPVNEELSVSINITKFVVINKTQAWYIYKKK